LDSFTFIASDGTATSSPATISIDVMRVGDKILSLETSNSLPSAYFQILDTAQNLPINITLKAEGADGDSLTYTIITSPSNGILSGNPPVLTYTPDHDFIGTDSFAFVVSDEISTSNTATVIIGVSRETQGLTIPFGEDWKIGNFPIIFLLVPPVVIVLTLVGFIYQHTRANGRYKRPQLHYFTTSINVLNSRKR
jgi:hypothetical protein